MELYLAVGDQNLNGAIDLTNRDQFILPSVLLQTHSGVQLPAGFTFAAYLRKPTQRIQGTQSLQDDRLATIPLLITGISGDDVQNSWHAIEALFTQAREASGPNGLGTNIVLWTRLMGARNYTYYDVLDGRLTPIDAGFPAGDAIYGSLCELFMLPWGRGDPVYYPSSSTYYTSRTLASNPIRLAAVPGDGNALCRTILVDQSGGSKYINEILMGRLSLKAGLGATDALLVSAPTSLSPGADHSDSGAIGGTASRLTPLTTSFQNVAKIDSSAVHANNIFDILCLAKSSLVPIGPPTNPSLTSTPAGGYLNAGNYTFFTNPYDGSVHLGTRGQFISIDIPGAVVTSNTILNDGFEDGLFLYNWIIAAVVGVSSSYAISASAPLCDGHSLLLTTSGASSVAAVARILPPLPATKVASIQFLYSRSANPGSGAVSATQGMICQLLGQNSEYWGFASDLSTGGLSAVSPGFNGGTPVFSALGVNLSAGTIHVLEIDFDFTSTPGRARFIADGTYLGTIVDDIQKPCGYPYDVGFICNTTTSYTFSQKYDNLIIQDGFIGTPNSPGTPKSGGSITFAWTKGVNSTGTFVLWQYTPEDTNLPQSPWYLLDATSSASLTLSTINDAGSATPDLPNLGLPDIQLPELRAGALVQGGSAPIRWEPSVQLGIGNSEWELVNLGTITLPPGVTQDGSSPVPWELQLQAKESGTVHGTLDIGGFFLLPHNLDQTEMDYPGHTLASLETWQGDTRRDMRTNGLLYNIGTPTQVDGSFIMSGPFTLGPGDNLVQIIPLVKDANGNAIPDNINTAYKVRFIVTPRVKWQY